MQRSVVGDWRSLGLRLASSRVACVAQVEALYRFARGRSKANASHGQLIAGSRNSTSHRAETFRAVFSLELDSKKPVSNTPST